VEDSGSIEIQLCGLSLHTQPFRQTYRHGLDIYIFRLQTEGLCEIWMDGGYRRILPGELLLFQPGELYEMRTVQNGQQAEFSGDYYVMCKGEWIDRWWQSAARPRLTQVADSERLTAVWNQLVLEARRMSEANPALVRSLMQALCYIMDRTVQESAGMLTASSHYALRMKYYIEEHAVKPIVLKEVAGHAGLSVSRAVSLFKQEFGLSILQYAHKLRLEIALQLMELSPMTLEQIAEASGFGSYTFFHRVFREKYGISPGKYRREHPAAIAQSDR
jgi:AraC family transcriptional regulator, arabinose operon regulatory protein